MINKIAKNKKGDIEWYFLFIVGVLSLMVYSFYVGQKKSIDNYIGEYQFSILGSDYKAESVLFYIQQSAKYSLQESVYDLAGNGGMFEDDSSKSTGSECGQFYGYHLWNKLDKDESENNQLNYCINENIVAINLESAFNQRLNQYLLAHPLNIPIDNYYYELNKVNNKVSTPLEITGKPIKELKFDILKDKAKNRLEGVFGEPIETPEGLIDFTDTEICEKGSTCLLDRMAYELLLSAQTIAVNEKVSLSVYSGYRDLQKQIDLWNGNTFEKYAQRYPDEQERAKYVCYPYQDQEKPCPHLTGKAVDVRFKGKTTETMKRDDWSLLHKIMSQAGWVRYGEEYGSQKTFEVGEKWHFECCGTNRYARAQEGRVTAIV